MAEHNSKKPRLFRPRPGMSELDQLLEEWGETLSDEERESALRILRPSDDDMPAEDRGDTGETR